jgi:hypothetical protein
MAAGCICVIPMTGDDFLNNNINEIEKLDFPERLKKLVNLAHKYDKNYAVHGSNGFKVCHKYLFNPPAKAEDVRAFERDFDIKLPESFFRYLTEIGNGGAGVDYGVYSLEQIRSHNRHILTKTGGKVIFEYENIIEKWKELVSFSDYYFEYYGEDDIEYQKIVSEMLKGLLVIGTNGCTYDHVIICEGKYRGMVGMIDWNLEEYSVPRFYGLDFESWICNHFRNIALGNVIKHRDNFWTVKR